MNIVLLRGVAGPLRRRPGSASLAPIADIRKDLASVWLRSAGLSPSLGSRELSVWAIPAGTSAMAIALLLAIGIILSVVFKSTARMVAGTAEARTWIEEASSAASGREVRPPSPRAALALAADPVALRRPELSGSVAAYCLAPGRCSSGRRRSRRRLPQAVRFKNPGWRHGATGPLRSSALAVSGAGRCSAVACWAVMSRRWTRRSDLTVGRIAAPYDGDAVTVSTTCTIPASCSSAVTTTDAA